MGQDHVCAHGVSVRTTKVWNEACDRCREMADAYEQQGRVIGGQLTKRYREGEFDHLREDHVRDHSRGTSRRAGRIRHDEWRAFWSEEWKRRKEVQAANKVAGISNRPQPRIDESTRRYEMWGYMRYALENYPEKFTPKMRDALELTYEQGLSWSKAAAVAVDGPISRDSFRDRLKGAELALRKIVFAQADGTPMSRVRHGQNAGRKAPESPRTAR